MSRLQDWKPGKVGRGFLRPDSLVLTTSEDLTCGMKIMEHDADPQ